MEARLSDKRIIVVMSRIAGKELNSNGLRMNTAVIRIRIENDSEKARATSSSQVGKGRIKTTRIAIMPMASARSLRLTKSAIDVGEKLNAPGAAGDAVVTSAI